MSKVLLVGKGFPDRGGIPSFLDTLLNSSMMREHEVRFLNVAHSSTPQGGKATLANLGRTVRDAVAVWRGARGQEVVHIHSALVPAVTVLRAALLAAAGRVRGCAVVVHAHGGNIESWLNNGRRRLLVRLAMLPAHRVVAVWTAGEQALRHVLPAEQVRLIDNGVQIEAHFEAEAAHHPPRILYVGLLTPRKGVLDLMEASRTLLTRGVEHELWIVGGTPDEGPTAEAVVRTEIPAVAHLLGTRAPEDMPAAYAAADVFCLPSWWEAMPLTILEAMASCLPVVATDVGDVSRVVRDGDTGLLVPPRSPQQLAAALETLLTDPELRRRMGAAGRAHVENGFSSDVTTRKVSDLYLELGRERR